MNCRCVRTYLKGNVDHPSASMILLAMRHAIQDAVPSRAEMPLEIATMTLFGRKKSKVNVLRPGLQPPKSLQIGRAIRKIWSLWRSIDCRLSSKRNHFLAFTG